MGHDQTKPGPANVRKVYKQVCQNQTNVRKQSCQKKLRHSDFYPLLGDKVDWFIESWP